MFEWERIDQPHAVYSLWSSSGEPLYIGCAYRPFGRISHHLTVQSWYQDVAKVIIAWHPSLPAARKVEAQAIEANHPRYNKLVLNPEVLGEHKLRQANRVKRGDGVHCPKCSTVKEKRKDPYCRECLRQYRAEYRRKILLT